MQENTTKGEKEMNEGNIPPRWQNQQEAFEFGLSHPNVMLDLDMGTGKTRTALDIIFAREDVHRVLVVCPKAVIPVWTVNLMKFHPNDSWESMDPITGTVKHKQKLIENWLKTSKADKKIVVVNYDIVWRNPIGEFFYRQASFDMVILDESHRAKAAGSKVSKYLAMLGKTIKYKLCLSGTPMANSPLDVYGQYRFLDPSIFGTRHDLFLQEYAIMGGVDNHFVVGFKNQKKLQEKFKSIAYTCKMEDIKDRLKLPEVLPSIERKVTLPAKDMKTIKELEKDFIAECGSSHVVVNNVLVKMLRLQQISAGFCITHDVMMNEEEQELNTAKEDELFDILSDISPLASVVVFCVFRHDIRVIRSVAEKAKRKVFELSGNENTLEEWKKSEGGVIAVQIQAGAEGVDMTNAHYAVYFSLPHSLALYNQSKARLYRPGQKNSVSFIHLIAEDTIDEGIYKSLQKKQDVIEAIKAGKFDFGYMTKG